MRSHIELDGRPYIIYPNQYRKTLSNPMAAKTSQGSSKYDDQAPWDYYVRDSWPTTIGATNENDGAAFIIGDTRYSDQITPAPAIWPAEDETDWGNRISVGVSDSIIIGPDTNADYEGISCQLAISDAGNLSAALIHMYVETPSADVTVTLDLVDYYTSASLDSDTVTLYASKPPGLQYVVFPYEWTGPLGTGDLYIRLTFSANVTIGLTENTSDTRTYYYDGATWVGNYSLGVACANLQAYSYGDFADMNGFWPKRAQDETIWMGPGGKVVRTLSNYKDTGTNDLFPGVTNEATDAVSDGTSYYIAYGDNHNLYAWNIATVTETDLSVKADRVEIGGGYLWRSLDESIYYSADESTWTEVDVRLEVIDIIFWNEFLYFITSEGLHRLGYADVPLLDARFNVSASAGLYVFQNRLYIYNYDSILEYDGSIIRNISPLNTGGGVPLVFDGEIGCLHGTNLFLYAGINASGDDGISGIYAYNGTSWCLLYSLGTNCTIQDIHISEDSVNPGWYNFYAFTSIGLWKSNMHEKPSMPSKNWESTHSGAPTWNETPWIYGGLSDVEKDWESISVFNDTSTFNFSDTYKPSATIRVYYKTESADSWILLSSKTYSVTSAETLEFRWSDYTTRPASEKIKVGIHILPKYVAFATVMTMRINAIRIKYHAMIADRYQWNVTIPVHDNQQLPDGSMQPYTVYEMDEHIDTEIRKTAPIIFTDIDEKEYEVKVLSATKSIDKEEWVNGELIYTSIHNVALEMVTDTEYTES